MRLLLDIGNSRLKWTLSGSGWLPGTAIAHAGRALEAALNEISPKTAPTELWVASVTNADLRVTVEAWARQQFGLAVHWAESQGSACGVRNAYAEPRRLGVDRWLAVIAGHARLQAVDSAVALVVDAGTALTLDVVDRNGLHRGGLIAPGLATQRQSVRSQTQVRAYVSKPLHPALLGQDTDSAVAWGTYHGAIGLIERIYAGICREYPSVLPLITGGDACLLHADLGTGWQMAPDLVLEGLQELAAAAELRPQA